MTIIAELNSVKILAFIRRLCWTNFFIVIALFGFLSTQTFAASFDCNRAASWVEKTVCSDEVLSKFDEQMAKEYANTLASLSPDGQKETKQYQKQWLKNLAPYCGAREKIWHDEKTQCLKDAYKKRIEQLQNSLIKYPERTFRNVYVTHSKAAKDCEYLFIEREQIYPQIETPRDENEKFWNSFIYKMASKELDDGDCAANAPPECENDCVNIDAVITVNFSNKHLISFAYGVSTYGHGAAHPYGNGSFSNWLLNSRKELKASDLFDDKTKWQRILKELVTKKIKEKSTDKEEYNEFLRSDALKEVSSPDNWQITKNGLGFPLFAPWWGSGDMLTIDWKTLDPYLSKNGRSLIQVQVEKPSEATTSKPPLKKATATVKAVIALPRTGQTTCYDVKGKVINCKNTGQDGELQKGVAWPDPRFTDNGDQTVTDNLTGLIWTKDGNAPGPDVCQPAQKKNWQQALDYAACLNANNYLGYNDWRLPNKNELRSLVNYGSGSNAAWLNTQCFKNIEISRFSWYWSSTTPAGITECAEIVSMDGIESGTAGCKTKIKFNYNVWPVRSGNAGLIELPQTGQKSCYDASGKVIACKNTGQDGELQKGIAWPNPRFTDNGDQTITDNLTGLIWTKDADAPGPASCKPHGWRNWQQALDYVACINTKNYLGYNDWRLPNVNELESLDHSGQVHIFDWLYAEGFTNMPQYQGHWTSSTARGSLSAAWVVDMSFGSVKMHNDKTDRAGHVWLVRGGK